MNVRGSGGRYFSASFIARSALRYPSGRGIPKFAEDLLLRVAALLVADDEHGPSAERSESGDDRRVVGVAPVAVDLDEPVDRDSGRSRA